MRRRSFTWVALAGTGLACVVAVSAATALASSSAASSFEIVATNRYEAIEPECPDCWPWGPPVQTFTSGAPFCTSGTVLDLEWSGPRGERFRRYTCTDGSGGLTLTEWGAPGRGEWTIVEGSGRYAGLRGKGSWREEELGDDPDVVVLRTTMQGVADYDAVAPSIAFTSASASKLRSPRDVPAYRIRVAFALRDDVEGNPVAYKLKVTQGRVEIAGKEGTTASGSASVSLRVEPFRKGVRGLGVHLRAWDPIGNEQVVSRVLTLPRR